MAAIVGDQSGVELRVRVDELRIDRSYQRNTDPARYTRIANAFDWHAFDRPVINKRRDGSMYVVDGFHRVMAVGTRFGGATVIPVIGVSDLTQAQEADLFLKLNEDRTAVPVGNLFNARIIKGDPAAIAVDNILVEHHYNARPGLDRPGCAKLSVPGDVIKLYEKGGAELLHRTINIIDSAWDQFPVHERTGGRVLRGVGEYLFGVDIGRFRKPKLGRGNQLDNVLVQFLSTMTPMQLKDLGRMRKEGGGAGTGGIPLYITDTIDSKSWRRLVVA